MVSQAAYAENNKTLNNIQEQAWVKPRWGFSLYKMQAVMIIEPRINEHVLLIKKRAQTDLHCSVGRPSSAVTRLT